MIYVGSYLKLMDNSGANLVQCIQIYSAKSCASVGDPLLVSIQSSTRKQKSKLQKGKLYRAVLVQVKKPVKRIDGSFSCSEDNIAILINQQGIPICSRFSGYISSEVRMKGFIKLMSITKQFH